jgi:hypothetical protein
VPVRLATQEAEVRRIVVRNQPRQTDGETLSQKNPSKNGLGAGAMVQGVGHVQTPVPPKKKKKIITKKANK